MENETELMSYLAGVIDSDGFITIQRMIKTVGKKYKHKPVYHSAKIGLSQTSSVIPKLLKDTFGGSLYEHQPQNLNHRKWYCWQIGNIGAAVAAISLRPHLRLKQKQAGLLIDFVRLMRSHKDLMKKTQKPPYRLTPKIVKERDIIYDKLTSLNKPRNRRTNI